MLVAKHSGFHRLPVQRVRHSMQRKCPVDGTGQILQNHPAQGLRIPISFAHGPAGHSDPLLERRQLLTSVPIRLANTSAKPAAAPRDIGGILKIEVRAAARGRVVQDAVQNLQFGDALSRVLGKPGLSFHQLVGSLLRFQDPAVALCQ